MEGGHFSYGFRGAWKRTPAFPECSRSGSQGPKEYTGSYLPELALAVSVVRANDECQSAAQFLRSCAPEVALHDESDVASFLTGSSSDGIDYIAISIKPNDGFFDLRHAPLFLPPLMFQVPDGTERTRRRSLSRFRTTWRYCSGWSISFWCRFHRHLMTRRHLLS